jgi:microcompartment protein CcmL/EutN
MDAIGMIEVFGFTTAIKAADAAAKAVSVQTQAKSAVSIISR